MSYNDSLKDSLVYLGYPQSVPDALNQFLRDRTGLNLSTPDMMYAWLESMGFEGSLSDKLRAYAVSEGFDNHTDQVIALSFLDQPPLFIEQGSLVSIGKVTNDSVLWG